MGTTFFRHRGRTQIVAVFTATLFLFNQISFALPNDSVRPGGQSRPKVILVQDIHRHAEAQASIADFLQDRINHKDIDLVAVEGAFQAFDFRDLRGRAAGEKMNQAADLFLRDQRISAPSYVAITSPLEPPAYQGIDDEKLYDANVEAYRTSQVQRDVIKKEWEMTRERLEETKRRVFNSRLKSFDSRVTAYDGGKIGLQEFLESVPVSSLTSHLHEFLSLARLEGSLNLEAVEKERLRLFENLFAKISEEDAAGLARISQDHKKGGTHFNLYYRILRAYLEKYDVSLSGAPALKKYLDYVDRSSELDGEKIISDVRELINRTYARLTKTEQERDLIRQSRRLALLRKMLDFEMTPDEWDEYKKGVPSAQFLVPRSFEAFYTLAELRSHIMAKNLLKAGRGARHQALGTSLPVVAVVGGFHAGHMKTILEKAGMHVEMVRPKITRLDESGNSYLTVFDQEKSPLENLLDGEQLTIYNAAENAGTPRAPNAALLALSHSLSEPKASVIDTPSRQSSPKRFATRPGFQWGWLRVGPALAGTGYYLQRVVSFLDLVDHAFTQGPIAVRKWMRRHPVKTIILSILTSIFWFALTRDPISSAVILVGVIMPLAESPGKFSVHRDLVEKPVLEVSGRMPVPSSLYEQLRRELQKTPGLDVERALERLSQTAMAPAVLNHVGTQKQLGANMVMVGPLRSLIDMPDAANKDQTRPFNIGDAFRNILKRMDKRIRVQLPDGSHVSVTVYRYDDFGMTYYFLDEPKTLGEEKEKSLWSRRWTLGRGALELVSQNFLPTPKLIVLNNQEAMFAAPGLADDSHGYDVRWQGTQVVYRSHYETSDVHLSESQLRAMKIKDKYITNNQGHDFPAWVRMDNSEWMQVPAWEDRREGYGNTSYTVDPMRMMMLVSDGVYTVDSKYHNALVRTASLVDVAYRVFNMGERTAEDQKTIAGFEKLGDPYSNAGGALQYYSFLLRSFDQRQKAFERGREEGLALAARLPDKFSERLAWSKFGRPMTWAYSQGMKVDRLLMMSETTIRSLVDTMEWIWNLGLVGHWVLLHHVTGSRNSLQWRLEEVIKDMPGDPALKDFYYAMQMMVKDVTAKGTDLEREEHRHGLTWDLVTRGSMARTFDVAGHVASFSWWPVNLLSHQNDVLVSVARLYGFLKGVLEAPRNPPPGEGPESTPPGAPGNEPLVRDLGLSEAQQGGSAAPIDAVVQPEDKPNLNRFMLQPHLKSS